MFFQWSPESRGSICHQHEEAGGGRPARNYSPTLRTYGCFCRSLMPILNLYFIFCLHIITAGAITPPTGFISWWHHEDLGSGTTCEFSFRLDFPSDSVIVSLLLHGDHPDGHDDLGEAVLPLHSQDLQAGLGDDAPHDVQMAADAAVDGVQLAALPRHIVLYYDDAIRTQTLLTAKQEVHQVFVCEVAWRERRRQTSGNIAPSIRPPTTIWCREESSPPRLLKDHLQV